MAYSQRLQSSHSEDLHRLTGQIIDHRLRVMSLHYTSPRQWLYQVEPPSVGKTRRALKVLGDPLAREPGAFYRLKTSYKRLKGLESPHLERVYECGLLHDLTPYILVSWEPHISLYEYMRHHNKPLSWSEAQGLLIGISTGLDALHQSGIAHGDLRAQHILLRRPPQDPIIIDACINSSFGSSPVPGLEKSLAYWAPERNTLSTATTSSDMYSFGVLMYFCLHNQLPFSPLHDHHYAEYLNQGDVTSPMRWLEESHVSRLPRPCSPDLPTAIIDILTRLLSKSPRSRPTAKEVIEVLKDPFTASISTDPTLNQDTHDSLRSIETPRAQDTHKAPEYGHTHTRQGLDDQASAVPDMALALYPDGDTRVDDQSLNDVQGQPHGRRALLMIALSSVSAILGIWLAQLY